LKAFLALQNSQELLLLLFFFNIKEEEEEKEPKANYVYIERERQAGV
jgi:hypothetical protein